ncbi:probable ATP-dependent RNA helicase DDX60 [Anabrus simplex]|uniref:probable ATP-dependent RNA helicase DDX60 n=1 Tax=Anabrus simplex TaxID=316456 RepID=UPI0035A2C873
MMDFEYDSDSSDVQSPGISSSDDEDCVMMDGNEGEGTPDIDAVILQLEAELKVEEKVKLPEGEQLTEDEILYYYQSLFEEFAVLRYEDITNLIVDGNMSLICGDSLLLSCMRNDYHTQNGGQLLHLVYLCERLIQLLQRKRGTFEFVFFDIWRQTLVDESLSLARSVLETHLKKNTNIKVHHFVATWDPAFKEFINLHKPSFLLVDVDLPSVLSSFQETVNVTVAEIFVYCQVLFALSLDLPCVSLEKVELDISVIYAFTVGRKLYKRRCRFLALNYLMHISSGSSENTRLPTLPLNSIDFGVGVDIRHVVTVMAASWYLLECKDTYSEDWIRVFLLYSAMIEILPLKNRGCPVPRETQSAGLLAFIRKIQFYMKCALAQFEGSEFLYDKVSDLWHGNLFINILEHINSVLRNPGDLGIRSSEVYMRLAEEVYIVSGKPFEAFPIITENLEWNKPRTVSKKGEVAQPETPPLCLPLEKLLPTSCQLSWEFCGDLLHEVRQQVSEYDARIHTFITKEASYTEVHHWHSHFPLTDEQDRIKNSIIQPTNDYERRKYERLRNKMAKFMDTYGASIEGRQTISKTIICKSRINSKKVSKEKKLSKNALKIIQANIEGKEKDAKKVEDEMLDNFKDNFKKWKQKGEYAVALESAKILRKKITNEEGIRRILMYIAQCCNLLWCDECRMKKKTAERDLTYAKELFLVVGQILTRSKETGIPLSDTQKTDLGKWLWRLGFGEVANLWKLPRPVRDDATFEVGLSWVRFQLIHLGADLKRKSTGEKDPRVDFVPDRWQKELFDIIDQRKSALIVAPTSSGKTYASYYCMETILTEDDEGVVVYVSPTKALVNQVAATVYSRFKGKRMPDGKSVFGVFTRDYRTDDMNCQILVTVPQCLEVLLLSPRRQAWVRKLRYVIFDEIHCLAGQAGGISWETCILMMRCPFLALSATIGNPKQFHTWLQDAENFKRERDRLDKCERSSYKVHLVVHSERHSDLKKYIYTSEGDMIHIHPYAYIDETVIREHNGIPNHISLAPEETFQLYMAMETASKASDAVLSYKPETYFSQTSFLTRNEVREYENKLRSLLQNWVVEDMETYSAVIAKLKLPLEQANIYEIGFHFVASKFLKFIQKLKEKQMLPTIFFRFDKGDLDYLFAHFVAYCSPLEIDINVSSNSSKSNDVSEENKKHVKSLCRTGGRASDVMEIAFRAGDFSLRRRQPFIDNRSLGLLEDTSSSSIRNVGFADKNDVAFIERRLIQSGYKRDDEFPSGLRAGLGKHHAAMNSKERSAVEMLFRMKVLNGVLATSTLALGIHMPCKTVVIGGNSLFFNTLTYHQMSGRAGRRGFDTEGNVVFFGTEERKIRTLLTGRLPDMIGNFPLTVTLVLRLLLLVNDVSEKGVAKKDSKSEAMSRALTYLNCNLVYQNIPELKEQMKHFFAFSTQLLMLQGILDHNGNPQKVCGILTHLHYHEPGNMVLVYLLRSGALRRLCKTYNGKITRETELNLVLLLSHLFARLPLHSTCLKQKYKNSIVILPPLPETVADDVKVYNEEVKFMYDHYFRCVANHIANKFGDDDTLPLSGVRFGPAEPVVLQPQGVEAAIFAENIPRTICSQFAALSGHSDTRLYSTTNVISTIRHQVFTDVKVIPLLDCSVQLNGYAWDFYNHGILASVINDNGILSGDAFKLLTDFRLMLCTVCMCLEEIGIGPEDDPVLCTFQTVSKKFNQLYYREFNITEKI